MLTRRTIGIAAVTENLLKHRWSMEILRHLGNGVANPAEIYKLEPALPSSTMSAQLRKMQRHDLIIRYPKLTPTRVIEYQLTDRGRKVLKMLNVIAHLDDLCAEEEILLEQISAITTPPAQLGKSPPPSNIRPKSKSTRKRSVPAN